MSINIDKTLNTKTPPLSTRLYKYRWFYVMFLPVLIFASIFYYAPLSGLRYAFYDYKGFKEPVFVAFQNFEKMFSLPGFWTALWNTI